MDAIAALITTPLMMGIGYAFAHNYDVIVKYVRDLKYALVALGIVGAFFIIRHYRRPKTEQGDQEDGVEE
jgi:membrane protein DedA with SNARE-associated domain